ncbi:MAG: MMPL family transporter [Proteobacteria bacterium]|nr:MMPL family transporter [Pseudomonadota bacterium]
MPAMFLLILVFLLISFRSFSGIVLPLVVIFGSVITVVGMLGVFGWSFNMLNVVLPVLLMTVGIGDSIHIIVEFYHFRNEGNSPKEAAIKATEALWVPCFNTSLTTSIGFLAISVSSLVPLREYGVVAAIGVFMAFLISVTTLPAILSFVNSKPEKTRKLIDQGIVARFTQQLMPFTFKYSKIISFTGFFVAFITFVLASQIKVDANFVNYFKDNTTVKADIKYFDKVYNGFANLEFKLDSKVPGGVKNPEFLQKALDFQNYLESLEQVGKANSLLNFIQKMNQTMHNDDPSYFKLPETRDLTAQYLLLYENSSPEEDLTDLKSVDESTMRISLKLMNLPTSEMKVLVDKVENKLATDFPELNAIVTGDLVLFNRMDIYIQEGLVKSFSLAIGLIVISFFILLRSFKYGMLAMIPSLFPIIFAGGLMYLLGITLDMATMIVAAVTFGIAVDDSIHVMTRYIRSRKSGGSRKESIHLAMTESGRALIFTSIILYFGFSILMLSSFVPNIYFGFFAGIIIMGALGAVLVLLPAIMFLTGDKAGAPVKNTTTNTLETQVT